MRAKGILTAVLAAGVLFLAPGFDGARADQNQRHGQNQQQTYHGKGHGYGWQGQRYFGNQRDGGYAYGQRARSHYNGGLSNKDRKKLGQIRQRFHNDRAFRHYLRQHKPGLFARYMDQTGNRHQAYEHQRPHRWVWYRGQTRQLR